MQYGKWFLKYMFWFSIYKGGYNWHTLIQQQAWYWEVLGAQSSQGYVAICYYHGHTHMYSLYSHKCEPVAVMTFQCNKLVVRGSIPMCFLGVCAVSRPEILREHMCFSVNGKHMSTYVECEATTTTHKLKYKATTMTTTFISSNDVSKD